MGKPILREIRFFIEKNPLFLYLMFIIGGIICAKFTSSPSILILSGLIILGMWIFYTISKIYHFLLFASLLIVFTSSYLRTAPNTFASPREPLSFWCKGEILYSKGNYYFWPEDTDSVKFLKNNPKILLIPPLPKKYIHTGTGFYQLLISDKFPQRNPGLTSWKNIMLQNKVRLKGRILDVRASAQVQPNNRKTRKFQDFIRNFTISHYCKPLDGFLTAIVCGDKELLPWQFKKKFQHSGLSHLLAISGLHMGIYLLILLAIFNFYFIHSFVRNSLISVILIAYLWAIDFIPSMSRAVIMGLCYLWAFHQGKIIHRFHPLILSAVILLLIDPLQLFTLGFQFSFLAVCGILLFTPPLWNWICRFRFFSIFPIKYLLGSMIITFSAQVLIFPFLANYFHHFSLLSFIANLFAIPITFLLILFFIFSLIASFIYPPVSLLMDEITHFLFYLLESALTYFQQLSWGFISLPPLSFTSVVCYFAVTFTLFFFSRYRSKFSFLFFNLTLIFAATIHLINTTHAIYILNVDQASAVIIAGKNNILLDAGRAKYNFNREYSLPLAMQNLNIQTLDEVYISHLDYDHYGQLFSVLNQWPECQVYLPSTTLYFRNKTIRFLRKIKNYQKIQFISAGYSKTIDINNHLLCLSPTAVLLPASLNATSLVFKIFFRDRTILFCGDADISQLKEIMPLKDILETDILIFPHHGSKTGFYAPFMEQTAPELTVFSCGWRNPYAHPNKAVIKYLVKNQLMYKRTDLEGCIKIEP